MLKINFNLSLFKNEIPMKLKRYMHVIHETTIKLLIVVRTTHTTHTTKNFIVVVRDTTNMQNSKISISNESM